MAFQINEETFAQIARREAEIAGLKDSNKENNALANSQKIAAYSDLIADLSQVKLVKGNLPRAVSKQVREALLADAGLKDATVKRYIDNSVGAIRHFKLSQVHNCTPAMVREFFDTEGVDSENKLAKLVNGEAEQSKARKLAEAVVGKWSTRKDENGKRVQGDVFRDGLSDDELEEFFDHMRELQAARAAYHNPEAAKQAEASAAEENAACNAVAAYVAEGLGEF